MKNKKTVVDWYLDRHGVLYVSGEGRTPDYSCGSNPPPPWHDQKERIKIVCIGEGITEIGSKAFEACENLERVILPNSLGKLHYECFRNCCNLREVLAAPGREFCCLNELPPAKMAKKMVADYPKDENFGDVLFGNNAFFQVPWAIEKWGDFYIRDQHLYACFSDFDAVKIPNGIETIHTFAFKDMNIDRIEFPNSLKRIEACAFMNTRIKRVVLPEGIEYVGNYAFADSPLQQVLIPSGAESIFEKDAFNRTAIPVFWHKRKRSPEGYRLVSKSTNREILKFKKLCVEEVPIRFSEKTGKPQGTVVLKQLSAGHSIMRRMYMGALILGVEYDEVSKVVLNVKSYCYFRLENMVCEYIMYPSYEENDGKKILTIGDAACRYICKESIKTAFFTKSVPDELVHENDIRKLTDGRREEWFSTCRRTRNYGEREKELLEKWIEAHPDYQV